jgi:ferredoxin/flavodoxin
MKTTIYYFSATGNSLSFARRIAAELGEAELIAISKVMTESQIEATTPGIGLVFPVYGWGPPRIVTDFAQKLKPNTGQYLFAVATCGGTPGATLLLLEKTLQQTGAHLNAGFVVNEGSYGFAENPLPVRIMKRLGRGNPSFQSGKSGKERLSEIVTVIQNKQQHKPETNSGITNFLGNLIHNPFIESCKTTDKDFWVEEKCNFCRTCERVCPRGNIKIEDKKHIWNHDCEMCFSCLQWCPKEAIQHKQDTVDKARHHHPDIKLKDMLIT